MSIKTISKSALIISAVAFSASAVANVDFKPYVGGQINYSKLGYEGGFKSDLNRAGISLKDKKPGISAFVGAKVNEYFGVELGYETQKDIKSSGSATGLTTVSYDSSVKFSALYLEAQGYYPIADQFELIGAFGFANVNAKSKITATSSVAGASEVVSFSYDDSKIKYRFGLGAKYNFDENLSARAMFRYQNLGGKGDGITSLQSVGLGVAYSF